MSITPDAVSPADGRSPSALSRHLTVISLIVPVVPLAVLLSTLPKLEPLLADLDIALPLVTQWLITPGIVGGAVLAYGVQAIVLTICSRVPSMRTTRLPVAGLCVIGWLVFGAFSLLGVLLPYLKLSREL